MERVIATCLPAWPLFFMAKGSVAGDSEWFLRQYRRCGHEQYFYCQLGVRSEIAGNCTG